MRPITGTHFLQRERCRRFVWLEFHGDPRAKQPPDPRTAARLERGRAHERAVVASLPVVEPEYPRGDFAAGARATRELLRAKTPLVYQGVLTGENRVGLPDLLRYDPAADDYAVGDVKASSELKVEHAMQVAFYAELLEEAAPASGRSAVPRSFLVLADGREVWIDRGETARLYAEAKRDIEALQRGCGEPRPAFGTHCHGCPWRGVCVPEMETAQDLTLVHGMTPARRAALEAAGVPNATALADADLSILSARCEIPFATLRGLRLQARSLVTRKPLVVGKMATPRARIAYTVAIESDPRGTHAHAFVAHRATRVGDQLTESWFHACAAEPADEERAYRAFLRFVQEAPDAPLYHFGATVPDHLTRLDLRHGRVGDPIRIVCERLADVQSIVRASLVLPTYSYDLRSLARALEVRSTLDAVPPGGADTDPSLHARRQLGVEVLTIREVRVAAMRLHARLEGARSESKDTLTVAP